MRIGVISDTHGLLRPEAVRALQSVDIIVHAGDVGRSEILRSLKQIAPVFAVRGNVDVEAWADELPLTATVAAGNVNLYLIHNLNDLDVKPETAGIHVVISGHTHQLLNRERDGVLYLNPGSAGPRRFTLPTTLMLLDLGTKPWKVQVVDLLAVPFR
jgi:uncharacterized protein